MELNVIGSSSRGNCYILENEHEALIIEAGCKFSDVKKALGFNLRKVVGCLITHEHGDHAEYAEAMMKSYIPVWASTGTTRAISTGSLSSMMLEEGIMQKLGNFCIIPFATKHDCAEPFGFYINHPETGNFIFATDTYYLPCKFAGLNNIMIECNYRLDLLEADIEAGKILPAMKDRTLQSHFSYDHCLEALLANDLSAVNNIVLLHLSDGNSNAEEFKQGIAKATGKTVHVAEKGMKIRFDKTPF